MKITFIVNPRLIKRKVKRLYTLNNGLKVRRSYRTKNIVHIERLTFGGIGQGREG